MIMIMMITSSRVAHQSCRVKLLVAPSLSPDIVGIVIMIIKIVTIIIKIISFEMIFPPVWLLGLDPWQWHVRGVWWRQP